jgi:hypothetical protein
VYSCGREGAVLFTAIHKAPELRVDSKLFREIVRMQLSLPLTYIAAAAVCICGTGGYHLVRQCNNGNERFVRHNIVRERSILIKVENASLDAYHECVVNATGGTSGAYDEVHC